MSINRSIGKFTATILTAFALIGTTWAADAPVSKLVIIKAVYGDLNGDNKTDVTAKVIPMIKDETLSVDVNNDNFGDPAEGTMKSLQVDYMLDGKRYTRIVNENQTMLISSKPSKLVITKAFYGDLPDGEKTDVLDKVAMRVNADSLTVTASNAIFGDPAEGVAKKLTVEYTFNGKANTKIVNEDETLSISDTGE